MKRFLATFGFLVLAVMATAEAGFLPTLPAGDFAAAGLQKLTPEEQARLEAFVQRYKACEVAEVRQKVEADAARAQLAAETGVIAAEAKTNEIEKRLNEPGAKTRAPSAKKQPGWFTALLTLRRAAETPGKEDPLESRLTGEFAGWNGRSVFNLEDGTRWLQQNKTESFVYSPELRSPKVRIKPAAIGGFWLEIEGVNRQVRVIPLELNGSK